jgi:hypothetical protein
MMNVVHIKMDGKKRSGAGGKASGNNWKMENAKGLF